jgi:glutaredoxin-related protein
MDTSLNKVQHKQELFCGYYFSLVGMYMLLRNLSKFIQLRSISKPRFNKIKTNSDITPPNNLDMLLLKFWSHEIFVSTKAQPY